MKVIENENTVFFDVDYTLIYHKEWLEGDQRKHCPVDLEAFYDKRVNQTLFFTRSQQHITLLKQCVARGRTVIVWSNNGHYWAKMIVKLLEIDCLIEYVMCKPSMYVDDKTANDFMQHVYLGNENKDGDK